MTHRSWFPFILIGLSMALLAIIAAVYVPSRDMVDDAPWVVAPTETEYETAVQDIVTSYRTTADAQAAYDALIALRVPSVAYQGVHLDLVIAFGQIVAGREDEGSVRLDVLRTAYPWLGL